MASGTRGTNTMTEQLRSMLGSIADMKAAPDADIAYLTQLETQVLQYLRAPFEAQRLQAQMGGPAQAGPMAQGQGPPAGAVAGQPSPQPGAGAAAQLLLAMGAPIPRQQRVAGVMQGHTMPNADELRRLMEQPSL